MPGPEEPLQEEQQPKQQRQAATLVATGLGLFMIFLDATIVNVALPDIQSDFDVGEAGIQWIVAAYSLTFAMFMMSSATFADLRGRRLAFAIGIVVFCGASLGCGLAPSVFVLNLFRGLQGVGAAIVNVASLAIVSAAYTEPSAKAKAIGAWTGIAAVGLAIGPLLGGVMTETFGWRSIFLINPAVGVVTLVLTYRFVAESKDPGDHRFDLPGQVLFILGIGSLTYALVEGPHSGWASPMILSLLIGSLVVLAAFIWAELASRDPMMDVRVFEDRVYTTAIITVFVVLFCIYGTLLLVTQYFQNVRDYSPERAGLLMLAMTVPTVILAPVAGRVTAKLGGRRPTLIGVTSVVIGMAVLAGGTGDLIILTLVGLAFTGAAGGLAVTPATSVAMSSVAPDRAGMASGILSVQRALGMTAGFAIMGSVLAASLSAELPEKFEPYISDEAVLDQAVDDVVEAANPRAVASLIGPGEPLPDTVTEKQELYDAADQAFTDGIRLALAVGFVLALGTLVAGFIIFPRQERAKLTEDEKAEAERLARAEADRRMGLEP